MKKTIEEKRFVWYCNFDQGTGLDRECCRAGCKNGRPVTKEKAERDAKAHSDKFSYGYHKHECSITELTEDRLKKIRREKNKQKKIKEQKEIKRIENRKALYLKLKKEFEG